MPRRAESTSVRVLRAGEGRWLGVDETCEVVALDRVPKLRVGRR